MWGVKPSAASCEQKGVNGALRCILVWALPGRGSRAENKMFCAVVNTTTYSYLVDMLLQVGGSLCLFKFWTIVKGATFHLSVLFLRKCKQIFVVSSSASVLLHFPWFNYHHQVCEIQQKFLYAWLNIWASLLCSSAASSLTTSFSVTPCYSSFYPPVKHLLYNLSTSQPNTLTVHLAH